MGTMPAWQGLFIDAAGSPGIAASAAGQRLCIYHPPQLPAGAPCRGVVVYVHPFAEEMNKARRMAALQSRALAADGFAMLQIDLLGCGDSSGEFGDATWDAWLQDVMRAATWLQQRHAAPLWLWGLRAGCLLAVDAAQRLGGTVNFLFWQPPAAGKTLLQQFLRLKLAGDVLGGKAGGAMDQMRSQLAAGNAVEVAGYVLAPALAAGLEQARLQPPAHTTRSIWFEVSARDEPALLPATQSALAAWQAAGHAVQASCVSGPAFWQTQEIEDAPALIAATRHALQGAQATTAQPQAVAA